MWHTPPYCAKLTLGSRLYYCQLFVATYAYVLQVALLTSLSQLLPPRSPTVSNPAPDSSLCRAAAPRWRPLRISCCSLARLHPLQLLLPILRPLPAAAPRLRLLQLLLHARRLRPFQLLLPIASASAAAPRLRPLRLLLPDLLAAQAGFQPNVLEHSSRSSRFSK